MIVVVDVMEDPDIPIASFELELPIDADVEAEILKEMEQRGLDGYFFYDIYLQ